MTAEQQTGPKVTCPRCGAAGEQTVTDLVDARMRQTVIACRAERHRCPSTIRHAQLTTEEWREARRRSLLPRCVDCAETFEPRTNAKRCIPCAHAHAQNHANTLEHKAARRAEQERAIEEARQRFPRPYDWTEHHNRFQDPTPTRTEEETQVTTMCDKTCVDCGAEFSVPFASRARKRCAECVAKLPKHSFNGNGKPAEPPAPEEKPKPRTCSMPGCSKWWAAAPDDEQSVCPSCREVLARAAAEEGASDLEDTEEDASECVSVMGQCYTQGCQLHDLANTPEAPEDEVPPSPETAADPPPEAQERLEEPEAPVGVSENTPVLPGSSVALQAPVPLVPPATIGEDPVLAAVLALEAIPAEKREAIFELIDLRAKAYGYLAAAALRLEQLRQEVA